MKGDELNLAPGKSISLVHVFFLLCAVASHPREA